MRKILLLATMFMCANFFSQNYFRIDSIPTYNPAVSRFYGLKFPAKWKYCKGDKPEWASPELDDKLWPLVSTELKSDNIRGIFEKRGWFRLWVNVDSSLAGKNLAILLIQSGASELYLDGNLVHRFGKIDDDPEKDERYDPRAMPVAITFTAGGKHLIAMRYSHATALANFEKRKTGNAGFTMRLGELDRSMINHHSSAIGTNSFYIFYFSFFTALAILHLLLYLHYKANRSNLYYSIFSGAFGLFFLFLALELISTSPDFTLNVFQAHGVLPNIYIPALLAMLYSIFNNNRLPKIFWLWAVFFLVQGLMNIFRYDIPYGGAISNAILIIEPLRIVIAAMIKKKDGAWIIGTGIVCTIVFFICFFTLPFFSKALYLSSGVAMSLFIAFITVYFTLNIPLSMSLYLAREFSKTNKNLQSKLMEVEELSAKSIEQEKEKQKILETQNVMLEQKVLERTQEITEQKKLIEEKNKDITDSINYAKRLQEAMLPQLSQFGELLPDSFVLYKPKDIVAGDFYWLEVASTESAETRRQSSGGARHQAQAGRETSVGSGNHTSAASTASGDCILLAAADCTGHGVPGAMVSVVCANALKRTVKEFGITEPGRVLDKTRQLVIETFDRSQTIVKDGMDISLLAISKDYSDTVQLKWSGANNPLWYIKKGVRGELTAHKQPVGKTENPTSFPTQNLELSKGDMVFLFTDGYADQFGGPKGKKFKYKALLDLFQSNASLPMSEMKMKIESAFEEWKGKLEQVDDVCIIGIRF